LAAFDEVDQVKLFGILTLSIVACALPALAEPTTDVLAFDPNNYSTIQITLDGQPTEVRRYRVIYVAKPTDIDIKKVAALGGPPGGPPSGIAGLPPLGAAPPPGPMGSPPSDPRAYQSMYIYVPASSYQDARKAIVLQVNNAGWMSSPARDIIRDGSAFLSTSDTDNTGAALKAGYIVVSAGTRSRGLQSTNGDWAGKAPAVVVDAKAAIRYLRHNDATMPGSAERIVITGTSGGGGLSVAVSASGNSSDYYPYLMAIGAAGIDAAGKSTIRDDVFATIAYCPINDLGNSDLAYEWQYSAVRTADNTAAGRYTPASQAASAQLSAQYSTVLNGLHLKRSDGSPLNAKTMPQAIVALVKASVEGALKRGEKIPALGEDFEIARRGPPGAAVGTVKFRNDWLTLESGQVRTIDYAKYLRFVAANQTLKGVPAFDATASTGNRGVSGENTLFGSAKVEYSNFTQYAWDHNDVKGDGSGVDDTGIAWTSHLAGPGAELARQIKMTSPLPYLRTTTTTVARYWYVRHGLLDRDTSFAVQATLAAAIQNNSAVKDVNFKIAWMQGHAGNYDVQEAYAWLAETLKKADNAK
jgi:hypothetical protein